MKTKVELIEEFSNFVKYVEQLKTIDDEQWTSPIAPGKWSIRDIIAHMMLWDQYFLEDAIKKIRPQKAITYRQVDFDEFNQKAVEFAKTKNKEEIIDLTVSTRKEILAELQAMSDKEFYLEFTDGDGNPFSAHQYVLDFLWHDNHHIKQMNDYLYG